MESFQISLRTESSQVRNCASEGKCYRCTVEALCDKAK